MSLNIKNDEVVRLAEWIASQTGESKTEAILRSLEIRATILGRQSYQDKEQRIKQFVREYAIPKYGTANDPIPQSEQDEILGYGPDGV